MPIVSKYVKLNTLIPLETLADFIANGVHFALAYLLLFMKYYVVMYIFVHSIFEKCIPCYYWTDCHSVKGWPPVECVYLVSFVWSFCSCDLRLDSMTLTNETWLRYSQDIPAYQKFLGQGFQNLEHEQDEHTAYTDTRRHDRTLYHPHLWVAK